MYKVTTEIHFSYGHRLLDYSGKCAHPHGHNGRVEIELSADTLDARDMLVDFQDLRGGMKSWIDKELDHRMILRRDDPLLAIFQRMGEPCYVLDTNPTAEVLAKLIYDHAASQGLPVSAVHFWETVTSRATYAPRGTGER